MFKSPHRFHNLFVKKDFHDIHQRTDINCVWG